MKKIYSELFKFLIWWLTFSIGVFLTLKVTLSVTVPYKFIAILLAGLIIEAVSKIMQIFKYKSEIHLNRVLLFWILIHSLSYLLMFYIVTSLVFGAMILHVLLMGLGITLITYFIWKVKIRTKGGWIISIIILFIILLYFTNGFSDLNIIFGNNFVNKDIVKVETKESCAEADLMTKAGGGLFGELFDMSPSDIKKMACIDICKNKGLLFKDYGCVNDIFTCYCKKTQEQIEKEKEAIEESLT